MSKELNLQHASILEDMSKKYWDAISNETQSMFPNAKLLSDLTVTAVALRRGAEALRGLEGEE